MKKFFCLILALALSLSLLAGCTIEINNNPSESETEAPTQSTNTEEPTNTEPSETPDTSYSEMLHQVGALCAVAYVGYNGGSFAEIQEGFVTDGLIDALPILAEVKEENLFSNEGSELYLVIPREDVGMTVHTQVMDEETGEIVRGETLHTQSQSEPILLRGNISDIFANIGVLLEGQGGETVEYCPSLSLMDGSLYVDSSLIFDITPYEVLGIYTGPEVGDEEPMVSSWFAEAPNTAGETMILELVMNYDGSASYLYGSAESEAYEFFEGTWSYDENNLLCLSLYGGPLGDPDSHYSFYGEFQWECVDNQLFLDHVNGYSLIYGLEGGSLVFQSSNKYALTGLWRDSAFDYELNEYLYYDLELLGDGKCSYLIHNGEGVTYEAYEGTWSVENGVLQLYARMHSGRNYQETLVQEIGGTYRAVIDADAWLKLSPISGDLLTSTMFEGGWEFFEPTVSYG